MSLVATVLNHLVIELLAFSWFFLKGSKIVPVSGLLHLLFIPYNLFFPLFLANFCSSFRPYLNSSSSRKSSLVPN